jgi:glycosyltransferase involved in cell wall biosynthesis
MRILSLTRYTPLGSSSRVRFYQYLPYLESEGIKIQEAPLLLDNYVEKLYSGKNKDVFAVFLAFFRRFLWLLRIGKFDLLWIEKELFPWLPAIGELLISMRVPYVIDYDDAIFHRYDLHKSWVVRTFLGTKIDKVMRYSTLVIAGNDYLAERARNAGAKRVDILPSVVDVERYPIKKASPGLNIGWIGSPATASFLTSLQPTLKRFVNHANVHVTLIGTGNIDPLPSIRKKLLPWNEMTEIANLQTFDVGIMPLPDAPFERGKCGYKLVQYMASGLPVIASPIGVNKKIVVHDKNGFLASTDNEWFNAFERLENNIDERQQMGLAGRKKAEESYNLRVTAPRLLELFRSVIE